MPFESLRLNLARCLVVVSFLWPFANTSYFFAESTVEINFFLVFAAMSFLPELLLADWLSLVLLMVAAGLGALWGPSDGAARLIIGVAPYLFLVSLQVRCRERGEELIPRGLAFPALCVFAGFSLLQYAHFYWFAALPEWVTNILSVLVPRYMNSPYDEFGERGVQGWASEPSSAAMTCLAFSVVAMREAPAKRWRILFVFALLVAVNKSIYALLFLGFLGFACCWGMRRRIYALAALLPLAGTFCFLVYQSSRVQMLRQEVLPFGLSEGSARELLRFAQILYPLASFPKIYHSLDLFGLTVAPLGILPLLVGYGSFAGCLLYMRLAMRSVRLIERDALPLAAACGCVLSFLASPDFIPVIIAFLYSLHPASALQPVPLIAGRESWGGKLARLLEQSAAQTEAKDSTQQTPPFQKTNLNQS
jgi:hypothetical protein